MSTNVYVLLLLNLVFLSIDVMLGSMAGAVLSACVVGWIGALLFMTRQGCDTGA